MVAKVIRDKNDPSIGWVYYAKNGVMADMELIGGVRREGDLWYHVPKEEYHG